MALISNGTTVASGGSVTVSSSAVLTATASASVGAVGTYGLLRHNNNSQTYTEGSTISGSSIEWTACSGAVGGSYASGTWRAMGRKWIGSNTAYATVWLRIS